MAGPTWQAVLHCSRGDMASCAGSRMDMASFAWTQQAVLDCIDERSDMASLAGWCTLFVRHGRARMYGALLIRATTFPEEFVRRGALLHARMRVSLHDAWVCVFRFWQLVACFAS